MVANQSHDPGCDTRLREYLPKNSKTRRSKSFGHILAQLLLCQIWSFSFVLPTELLLWIKFWSFSNCRGVLCGCCVLCVLCVVSCGFVDVWVVWVVCVVCAVCCGFVDVYVCVVGAKHASCQSI